MLRSVLQCASFRCPPDHATIFFLSTARRQPLRLRVPVLAGLDTRLVPLHRYFIQALDLMYAHLKSGAALPPSQVVRTVPRGGTAGSAPAVSLTNVLAISATPKAADQIDFSGTTVSIPD